MIFSIKAYGNVGIPRYLTFAAHKAADGSNIRSLVHLDGCECTFNSLPTSVTF